MKSTGSLAKYLGGDVAQEKEKVEVFFISIDDTITRTSFW
jgi:hypothetical protein